MAKVIGCDFAKCFWKKAPVQLTDGVMNVFFGSGDSALGISVGIQWINI